MTEHVVAKFFNTIDEVYKTGKATEHSYRIALHDLLKSVNPKLDVINEPRRVECGSPDFAIMRGDVPVGYVEAKRIDIDIRPKKGSNKEQQDRYRDGLANLIYTNGTDWDFYRHDADGKSIRIAACKIADFALGLQPDKTQFDVLQNLLFDFVSQDTQTQTITSSNRLAKIMAGKAKLIRDAIGKALIADKDNITELAGQYVGFRDTLLHDIKKVDFADIYAETIVYGMFAARYHDKTPENFSRQEALELLPKSNPFLRKLFTFIAAHDLDEGIRWIIDDLANIFQATNVKNIMNRWSDSNDQRDPFLHFYETFLAEYNPKKRKSRGVWYTPEPVVNFIVRAVDDVLKTEFNLPDGLADTSKVKVQIPTGETKEVGKKGKKKRVPVTKTEEVHRVQILDPATGTGTFLAEVINQITPRIKTVNEGGWSNYVEKDLIPRLHGFELLMASYSMCHMKLDMMLSETGYVPSKSPPRLSVWLTNSLEEPEEDIRDLLMAKWLSEEAKGANSIKRDKPIMCIIGNPPYSASSQNKGEWITELIKDYKLGLNEKKINLDDDYIKFLRFSQNLIAKNGEGIVAMITNNSFLDGITHRRMRESLKTTFDSIHVLNLHGSSVREERSPDGGVDENVFDIMQGVSITLFVKKSRSKGLKGTVRQADLYGKRELKYENLSKLKVTSKQFKLLKVQEPHFFFTKKDFSQQKQYEKGFNVKKLMPLCNSGVKTDRDKLFVDKDKFRLSSRITKLLSGDLDNLFVENFNIKDSSSYKITSKIALAKFKHDHIQEIHFRPFDVGFIYYDPAIISRPAKLTSKHFCDKKNYGLLVPRQAQKGFHHVLACNKLVDVNLLSNAGMFGAGYTFPLYLYPDENDLDQERRVNMDADIRKTIEDAAEDKTRGRPDELAIFDYIYGVLHCPAYRETYCEFLKIDFPRVPYPSSPDMFWDVSAKGQALRVLHLMDGVSAGTAYPFKGDPVVDQENLVDTINAKSFHDTGGGVGNVHINKTQYFEGVPKTAWGFFIGGYKPAQKWLKDRKNRTLSHDDIMHYRKIIHILLETDRVMNTIDITFGDAK